MTIKHASSLFVAKKDVWHVERSLRSTATRFKDLAATALTPLEKWECLGQAAAYRAAADELKKLRVGAQRVARRPIW